MRRRIATAGPVVTKTIIFVNLAVFLAVFAEGADLFGPAGRTSLQGRLALFGPAVADGQWYRLITSGFVHYGIIHIAFNMAILYHFGRMLEPALGHIRMVALYFTALLGGSLGAVLLDPRALTAGASGAVFGLVAAAAIGLRQRGVDVWASGVGPLLALNLVLTFVVPGISIGGHVGGMVAGGLVSGPLLATPARGRYVAQGAVLAGAVSAVLFTGAIWVAGQ